MARLKDLEVKASIVIQDDGEVKLSVHKKNNFADTVTINIDDESGSGIETDVGNNLRVYATGTEAVPSLSFSPSLTLDEEWYINLVFESTDQKERLEYDFTMYADSAKTNGATVHLISKAVKAL